jgi:hypothetical protein
MIDKKKMRELLIFKNNVKLNDNLVLHQDDMTTYNSWFLTEYHSVEKVVFRGIPDQLPVDVISKYKINQDLYKVSLNKLGNPKNILVTFSTKDTY